MSQERVARLESLLSRVQENRKRSRTPLGLGLVPDAAPVHAAPRAPAPETVKAAPAPEPFKAPAAAAQKPAAPQPVARPEPPSTTPLRTSGMPPARPPAPAPARPPAARLPLQEPAKKSGQTPLEMAMAGLDTTPGAAAAPIQPAQKLEPAKPAAQPVAAAPVAPPMAPPIAPDEAFEGIAIEPEPIREPARPIAQVVSRHSPQVDATFGAMLKRSLSLRPH